MSMLLTTAGFILLTALCVVHHLRRTGVRGQHSPAKVTGAPCPRCKAAVPAGAAFCPGCGVPQQIFELVSLKPVIPKKAGGADSGRKHAVVRADMCVGCGTCAAACPVPGALRLEGKLAVVEMSLCAGHAKCSEACPVGAIVISTGGSVHKVEVPDVRPDFQTNVPGIYIVGELGGRGLIKNAVNEGKIAIEHVARELPPGTRRADGHPAALDVVIVGSGPAGLSAGLEALRSGLSYVILEQGNLADSIRKFPRHKILMAEPVKIPLYGDLWVADGSKESLLKVWETIIANTGLDLRTGQHVDNVVRKGPVFVVQVGETEIPARRVVLAMGRRGTPRRLGCRGEDLPKVFYEIVEMEAFKGRRVLVVGGGDSAVESVLGLANQAKTEVVLSYRGERFERVNERNRKKLETAATAGRIKVLLRSHLTEIRKDVVALEVGGQARILPNDDVIIRIGGEPPVKFLERLGVNMVEKDVPLPTSHAAAAS